MTDDLRALALTLDDAVREVAGVITLFAADPVLLRSAKQLAAPAGTTPLVQVSRAGDALEVVASVGVHGEAQAPVTASAVASAIRAALPAGSEAEISVRVSRVS